MRLGRKADFLCWAHAQGNNSSIFAIGQPLTSLARMCARQGFESMPCSFAVSISEAIVGNSKEATTTEAACLEQTTDMSSEKYVTNTDQDRPQNEQSQIERADQLPVGVHHVKT